MAPKFIKVNQSWKEYFLFILLLFLNPTSADQGFKYNKFQEWENSEMVPTRLLQLMRTYFEEAVKRITDMNPMRFMYEVSPYYELGYVISEILERYRKMVENLKRPLEFKSDNVFATLKRTELIQKLHFEIFHLVNMLHEIPRKYKYMPEFQELLKPSDLDELLKREAFIKDQQRMRKLRAKEEKKRMKLLRELFMKMKVKHYANHDKKAYNKWWPINYGWEIDYYW